MFFFFFLIFTGIRLRHRFFCNSHALLGKSRGYCTKTKQEWPDSGSTLENIFCNFYEINFSQDFFLYCKHFGVDGSRFFEEFWGILGALCKGEGTPGTVPLHNLRSHFTCSSPRRALWVVPSTLLGILRGPGERGRPWYGTFATRKGHFTEGMFEKC